MLEVSDTWSDVATHDESEYPQLWDSVVLALSPGLGPSGLSVRDWSGLHNYGTLTNMVAATDWVLSNGRYALEFDAASSQSIRADGAAVRMQSAQAWSISFWASATSYTANPTLFALSNSTFVTGDEFNIYPYDNSGGNGARVYFNGTNIVNQNSGAVAADGQMHHFCFVSRNSTDHEMFVDGVSVGASSTNKTLTANIVRLYIGNTVWGGPATAQVDDYLLYLKALSLEEIRFLSMRRGIAWERKQLRRYSVAGGSPVSLTAGVGSGTGAGHAPAVMVGAESAAGGGSGTGSGTGPSLGIGNVITAGSGSGTGGGHAPTIQVGGSVLLSVGVGSGSGTGAAPSLIVGSRIGGLAGSGTGSGKQPSLELGAMIPCFAGSGTGSGHAPTISTGAAVAVRRRSRLFAQSGLFV